MSIEITRLPSDSQSLIKKLEAVLARFETLGFENVSPENDSYTIRLRRPGDVRKTYVGTYLNEFSCIRSDERPGKVCLWQDSYLTECPTVAVQRVYRHNGTAEDVSLKISVWHGHSKISSWMKPASGTLSNPVFVREDLKSPRSQAEFGYPFVSSASQTVFEKKIPRTAGVKAVDNAVKAAVAAYESFVPVDHSAEALDPKDFHRDTTEEYFAQEAETKRNHGD